MTRIDIDEMERKARHEIERPDRSDAVDDWVATPEEALALIVRIRELEDAISEHDEGMLVIRNSKLRALVAKGAVLP